MNIARGMLRISIIAGVLVAAWGAWASHLDAAKERERVYDSWINDVRIWKGLRCGSKFLGKDVSAYTNEFGLIDIGRAGCAAGSFLARFDEIRQAMNQSEPVRPENAYWTTYRQHTIMWLVLALIAFCVVNLLGFLFLGARSAARWIKAGFQ